MESYNGLEDSTRYSTSRLVIRVKSKISLGKSNTAADKMLSYAYRLSIGMTEDGVGWLKTTCMTQMV